MSAPTVAHERIGTVLDHRYRLDRVIGEGGMGVVFAARDLTTHQEVAVKLLKTDLEAAPEAAARFQREAGAISRLRHPNTVRLYDFQQRPGHVYIVTELLAGQTLGGLLAKHGAMHPAQAVQVATAILASLQEAHDAGLIHRDLKPDNIFLVDGPPTHVKVLDFGLVKLIDDTDGLGQLTKSGVIGGTPRYTSPENARGEPLDPRADLYAVGILLFEMLSGRPPFDAEMAVDLLICHIESPPPSLHSPTHHLPAALPKLVDRCLQKQPRHRPPSAAALRAELTALLPELSAARPRRSDDPPVPKPRPPAKTQRGGLIWAIAIGSLVGLAVGALVFWAVS